MQAAETEKAVIVKHLVKQFGKFKAVDDVSFEVEKGAIYGFLGPNGAGKSTTIRMLCGILPPTSGQGFVAGYDIYKQREEIKAHIGYMSQKFSLYDDLTVEENIDFYSGIYLVPEAKKKDRKEWVVQMAGLQDRLKWRTSTLPTGWKQKLALGCAILHEPSIIFLDEPTAGVDPINRRLFWDLIYTLSNQNITVFVTTHYMDEAEYFDRIGFIYQGKLIAAGTPEQLKNEQMPQQVLEVWSPKPQEMLFALQNLPGLYNLIFFEDRLHIIVDDYEEAKERVKRQAESQGLAIQKIERVAPSLEDVFVSLTQTYDQKTA